MKGGDDGAIITPGDSAGSVLVQVQSEQHFATFTRRRVRTLIKQWIDAGAPEN